MLGLDGAGGAERFADYSQWEAWQRKRKGAAAKEPTAKEKRASVAESLASEAAKSGSNGKPAGSNTSRAETRRKLSYQEQREFADMEETIAQAEELLAAKKNALADPEVASDGQMLVETCKQMEEAQHAVEPLLRALGRAGREKGINSRSKNCSAPQPKPCLSAHTIPAD